jgi:hypothetical protein
MNVYTGKIFDIITISPYVAQIVLKKKENNKIVPVAITISGYWKDKALNDMKIKVKDKIKGKLHLKSEMKNGRYYYTDVFFKDIYVIEKAPREFGTIKFDKETGEVLED